MELVTGNKRSESEAEQNLWRWVVLLLLGLLAVESWTASRTRGTAAIVPTEPLTPQ